MIDFHSHILPGMDDGSRHRAESEQMLRRLAAQQVSAVVATPHFYAHENTPEEFLHRRAQAVQELSAVCGPDLPRVIPGAEVFYYSGISRMEALPALCLEGTRTLLLEMPSGTWSRYMLGEVIELAAGGQFQLVLAHVDRYRQKPLVWEELLEHGCIFQMNASFFVRHGHQAAKLLKRGWVHLLGSDCHNLTDRPPELEAAVRSIRRFGGQAAGEQIMDNARFCLARTSPPQGE